MNKNVLMRIEYIAGPSGFKLAEGAHRPAWCHSVQVGEHLRPTDPLGATLFRQLQDAHEPAWILIVRADWKHTQVHSASQEGAMMSNYMVEELERPRSRGSHVLWKEAELKKKQWWETDWCGWPACHLGPGWHPFLGCCQSWVYVCGPTATVGLCWHSWFIDGTKDHKDAHGLSHHLKPCWCKRAVTSLESCWSEWPVLPLGPWWYPVLNCCQGLYLCS